MAEGRWKVHHRKAGGEQWQEVRGGSPTRQFANLAAQQLMQSGEADECEVSDPAGVTADRWQRRETPRARFDRIRYRAGDD
jgi:hypothetical protein